MLNGTVTDLSSILIDHFREPRNVGHVDGATGNARVENPACGDVLEIEVLVEDGALREVAFMAQGCVSVIGGASFVSERARGAKLDEIEALDVDALLAEAQEVRAARRHGVQMAVRAIQQAVRSSP